MGYQDYLEAKKASDNPFTDEEISRLINTESSQNPYAINKETKAMGYGQFTPETLANLHKQGIKFDPFDKESATGAIKNYLSILYKQTGSKEKALAAYGGFVTKDPSIYINKIIKPSEIETVKEESLLEKRLKQLETGEKSTEPTSLTTARTAELVGRGMTPAVTGAAIGSVAGPGGALIGSMALPIGDVLNTAINKIAGTNLQMPSEIVSKGMAKAGYKEPTNMGERVLESIGSAFGGTSAQLPAFARMATESSSPILRSFASQMAQAPKAQLAAAAPTAAVGQVATELTGNPVIGAISGAVASAPFGFKTGRLSTNAPSQESLLQESKNLFTKAKDSGIVLEPKQFAGAMKGIENELRTEGYRPPIAGATDSYAKITNALTNLTDPNVPKDFVELQGLRKVIQNAQSSADPSERRLAGILKDHFDDYVLNAPESSIQAGSKQGLDLWKDARQSYSKLKKAEIFDDMLTNAELDKTKYTQSGAENSLAMQLRNLAKNDKKMRLFSKDEQDAIMEAAKGGVTQRTLKTIGKFFPNNPMSSLFDLELMKELPVVGSTVAFSSGLAKKMAEQRKIQSVSNLADMMRLGSKPEVESRIKNVPSTVLRGLLSGGQ
jgi:hypothetical protein